MTGPLATGTVSELRHELRTPVNLILGYAEMLLEDLAAGDARIAPLEEVCAAGREVLDRINTMLPGAGGVMEGALPRLLDALAAPQQRVLAAIRALDGSFTDEAAIADLRKIAAAAERLTAVPMPAAVGSYQPRTAAGAAPDPADDAVPTEGTAARILVVDDVEENRAVLAKRLERNGHQVRLAGNGRIALELLAAEPFDLVLLDVMMPEVDGFQVLERMRGTPAWREIPVIMISALDDLASVVRCIEFGAEDYLPKPFDPVLLRARIGAALEKKRFRDREAEYLRLVERVTGAAAAAERGQYTAGMLTEIGRRDDELGRLARVFDTMMANVRDREERLRAQLGDLRAEVAAAVNTVTHENGEGEDGALRPGDVFAGRFTVSQVLGAGGMGMVYRAHDRELAEDVAVKLLRPELLGNDVEMLERFKNEIRLARRISHRNVVRTHDFGESDGTYFVTMEYVAGMTVRDLLVTRGRLGWASTLGLARQLVEALAVAHEAGIIHRDVKPENALLDQEGVLKVMDFGIARLAQSTSNLTQAGMVVGTPTYMSPEQLLGEEIDGRTDLYAVGVLMYECLTGTPPFTAASPVGLIAKVLSTVPPAPITRQPDVPPALSSLVMTLLAKDAGGRPASARALLGLLLELD